MATTAADATAPVRRGGSYPALDGLRAVAVVCVVLTHLGFQTGETFRGSLGSLLGRLDFGVTVFFLLSGFLLYGPFVRAELHGKPVPHVTTYFRNRALRVLPAYWLVVLVVLPVMAWDFVSPSELMQQLLLLQVYDKGHLLPGLTQMWSLCVEVTFYLALPLLAWVGRRWGHPPLLAGMVAVAIGWTLVSRGLGHPDPAIGGLWLPAYLDWFAVGMGVAVLRARHEENQRWPFLDQLGDAGGTCVAVAALLLWLTATPLGGPLGLDLATPGQALTKHLLYGASALFLLLPAVFGTDPRSPVRRVLEHPVARWMGEVSYGVFLWHLLVLHLVYSALDVQLFHGDLLLMAALVLPLSFAVAAVSLRLVERPALAQKHRWATEGR